MTMKSEKPDLHMDHAALYREEVFTDRKVGSIRRLMPVKADGSTDAARAPVYTGEAQLLTSVGALPLSFEIAAKSLDEAASKYGEAANLAFEQAVEELQNLRRRASSGLILPDSGAAGLNPAGIPGAGKLKLP